MINLENFQLESLKEMSISELEELARTIRENIIYHVSQNGGHLASNLGVVELTIALHVVFNSPFDKLIFDVSHQTYTHKILTGRSLKNLRTMQGISGFLKTSESEHDVFEAGHSSTSIASALGFALARENGALIGEIITVIGDASITNGLSFEALNLLGDAKNRKVILIVNDNEMSISKNVGALARTFNKIQIGKGYRLLKKLTPKFVMHLAHKISGSVKSYVYNDKFFHSLGFSYIEGIDGHNFKELIKYFNYAKNAKKSVVLHVKTIKGKGYLPAENDSIGYWHHSAPFDKETGKPLLKASFTNGEALSSYLIQKVKQENWNKLMVITPAMSLGSGLEEFARTCPKQFIDVGIAEETAVVMASSLSISGFVPFIFIYSSFLQRTYDEILHDLTRTNQHAVFCVDRAGIVAGDGDTHQGIYDMAFLKTIPGITLFTPKNIFDLQQMVGYAYSHHGVFVIRYQKNAIETRFSEITIGKWQVLLPYEDNLIITYGSNVNLVYQYLLDHPGDKSVGLVDANTIKPLDTEFLDQLINQPVKLYIMDEVIKTGSLGEDILNYFAKNHPNKLANIEFNFTSLPDDYLKTGTEEELREFYHLSVSSLFQKIED